MKKAIYVVLMSYAVCIYADWAEDTLAGMTLLEKIGQMCIATVKANDSSTINQVQSWIKQERVGGVLLDTDSDKTLITPADKKTILQNFQNLADLPLFIIQDMEASLAKQLESSGSSDVMGLDLIPDHRLIGTLGESVGNFMKSLGVNMLLTPVVSVDANIRNKLMGGAGYINPRELARRGFSFVQGLRSVGIMTCAKHFPSEGNLNVDPHIALPVMYYSRETLDAGELDLFKELIKNGIDGIMTSHIYIPAFDETITKPASLLPEVVTELLQTELGYSGLIITDELEIRTKTLKYTSADFIIAAFDAGNDLILGIEDVTQATSALKSYVGNSVDRKAELDRRVLKILRLKERLLPEFTGSQSLIEQVIDVVI